MDDNLTRLIGMKVIFYVPPPIEYSGGHRTIYRHINFLAEIGCEVEACFVGKKSQLRPENTIRESIFSWFGLLRAEISTISPREMKPDIVIATSWWTAFNAATWDCPKIYFIQDMENSFNPANETYSQALSSYEIGLDSITIGKWLKTEVERYGSRTLDTPFGVDVKNYYKNLKITRETKSLLILDQPDKARRCHNLLQDTVSILKAKAPSIQILSYGTQQSYLKGVDHHFGLLTDLELGKLYRQSSIGIALSATNPSRIPFEMAACGLPFIELDLPNTRCDYEGLNHRKSLPFQDHLSDVVIDCFKTFDSQNLFSDGEKIQSLQTESEKFALNILWFLDNPAAKPTKKIDMPEIFLESTNHLLGIVKKHAPLRAKLRMKKWLQ
jgi:O-antigen biosynthesis protein